MKIQIKNRFTGSVIYETAAENLGQAILIALTANADLLGADLTGANLTGADLSGANLSRANLSGADLTGADLLGANLTEANLTGANLSGANLTGADLTGANLTGADLTGADLIWADLTGADLLGANLTEANLTGANLTGANLTEADLTGANLTGADLSRANLSRANLSGAKGAELAIAKTRILPEGDLIGWKKCRDRVIVKLLIPAHAKRTHAFGRKCRASEAKVLEVTGAKIGVSDYDGKVTYKVGKTVKPTSPFCDDWTQECASGIHFFITRIEAENYEL